MDPIQKDFGALHGLRVLDLATFIAGPYAASLLGEFGAEVIKIENPKGGDPWRRYGTKTARDDSTLAWAVEARNKKSITLNLRAPEGAELLKKLVRDADVVVENFRPGTLEKWGLGWDVLSAINPGLIMLRVSGYGQTGPYRDRPGFARIAHAVGGLTYLSGLPDEIPVTPGSTSLGDYMTGLYGVVGILTALRHRDATGKGQMIDAALYESVFRVLDEIAPRYAVDGFVRQPEGTGTVNACPHGHFPCADGTFVAIACTTDKMFERLTQAMERPDLAEAYGEQATRLANREIVLREVTAWTSAHDRVAVMAAGVAKEVPIGPVNSIKDIFEDPHFQARGNLQTVQDPDLGPVTVPGVTPTLSATPGAIRNLGPALGNANEEVYGGLGLSQNAMEKLRTDGVI